MAGTNQPHESPTPTVDRAVDPPRGYYERKAAGICTRPGCPSTAAQDSLLCARHLKRLRKGNRESARRRRAQRRDAGLCATPSCKAKCETWYCAACAIRRGRIPTSAVDPVVDQRGHGPRGVWRDDVHGHHRYRGKGKRGAPPPGAHDETNCRIILDAFQKFVAALAYVRSPEVEALPRIQKQAAHNEAAAWGALGAGMWDEMVDELRKGR